MPRMILPRWTSVRRCDITHAVVLCLLVGMGAWYHGGQFLRAQGQEALNERFALGIAANTVGLSRLEGKVDRVTEELEKQGRDLAAIRPAVTEFVLLGRSLAAAFAIYAMSSLLGLRKRTESEAHTRRKGDR